MVGGARRSAHPAHAEEVNYPLITGFNRFYSATDDPQHLAEGGQLLLNELNCVSCHQPPEALHRRFSGLPGPRLTAVASRFGDASILQILIRNPRILKRSTPMPSLFAGPDRDEDELAALYALSPHPAFGAGAATAAGKHRARP